MRRIKVIKRSGQGRDRKWKARERNKEGVKRELEKKERGRREVDER